MFVFAWWEVIPEEAIVALVLAALCALAVICAPPAAPRRIPARMTPAQPKRSRDPGPC